MKSMTTLLTALGISLLTLSSPAQAGDDAMLKGFLGVMTAMQKQAGDGADPTGKAVLDAFSDAIDDKGKGSKGKGDRQRQGKNKGNSQRQGKNKGNRQGKGDRQGKGNRQARR